MVNALSVSTDHLAKVVLVGSAGAGKSGIVKAVAEKYVHSSVRAGEIGEGDFFRTEFLWPEPMIDGGSLPASFFGGVGYCADRDRSDRGAERPTHSGVNKVASDP
jgi:hypothetical protein